MSISDAICTIARTSSVSIMPRNGSRTAGARDMRDDGEIDGRQHGLSRTVVDRLASEQDLLVALRDDAKTQVVDAVQGFGRRLAAVQRQRRNGSGVVAVGLGKASDGASQDARRRTHRMISASACFAMSDLRTLISRV